MSRAEHRGFCFELPILKQRRENQNCQLAKTRRKRPSRVQIMVLQYKIVYFLIILRQCCSVVMHCSLEIIVHTVRWYLVFARAEVHTVLHFTFKFRRVDCLDTYNKIPPWWYCTVQYANIDRSFIRASNEFETPGNRQQMSCPMHNTLTVEVMLLATVLYCSHRVLRTVDYLQ